MPTTSPHTTKVTTTPPPTTTTTIVPTQITQATTTPPSTTTPTTTPPTTTSPPTLPPIVTTIPPEEEDPLENIDDEIDGGTTNITNSVNRKDNAVQCIEANLYTLRK